MTNGIVSEIVAEGLFSLLPSTKWVTVGIIGIISLAFFLRISRGRAKASMFGSLVSMATTIVYFLGV